MAVRTRKAEGDLPLAARDAAARAHKDHAAALQASGAYDATEL